MTSSSSPPLLHSQTEPVRAASRRAARPFFEAVVDRVWRFFCSVRAAIAEIVVLALIVLLGTLRGSSVPFELARVLPISQPLVDRWYAWDAFHSLPFMAILTILSIAITICTLNRAPAIWSAIVAPTVTTTHGFLRNAESSIQIASALSTAELARQLGGALRSTHYRVMTSERHGEIHLYADRFRFARLGTFPFHLALILILIGGIVGARFGFRNAEFIIPEGSVRVLPEMASITVRLDDFSDNYRDNGAPSEYRSDLTVFKHGEVVKQGTAIVNHPLTYGDLVFYQTGFGQAVVVRIANSDGSILFDDALPLIPFRSKLNPDAPAAHVELAPVGMTLTVIAPDENPTNAPELDTLNLRSGQMYFLLRPLTAASPITLPTGLVMTQGKTETLAGLSFTFVREKRATLLQVGRNPGIPIFLAAAFLLVGGLAITLYFPHRRIRGIIAGAAAGGSQATLAPLARRDWSGQRAFAQVVDRLEQRLGTPIERIVPSDEGQSANHDTTMATRS